jgi:hypothetical protein
VITKVDVGITEFRLVHSKATVLERAFLFGVSWASSGITVEEATGPDAF